MRSQESEPEREGRAHDDLVRRLDALSNEDTQRVLERAIRLQMEKRDATGLSRDQIARIAGELGVEPDALDRAFREEAAQGSVTRPAREARVLPRLIVGRVSVDGTETEVAEEVMAWMEGEEGLRGVARTGDGVVWEKDTRWTTTARMAMGTEGTASLRGMPTVQHRQISVDGNRQVVEIEVDTARIRLVATSVGAGLSVLGVATGVGLAVGLDGNDLAQFLTGLLPGVGLGAGVAVITAKAWGESIKHGVQRALSGIAHPELHQRSGRRQRRRSGRSQVHRSGFHRIIDEVSDVLDDLFD